MTLHPPNNEKMSQFYFSYMTNRTLREQEIKMMTSAFSINTIKCIKTVDKNMRDISLIIFHEKRDTFMFMVLGYFIYKSIENFICIDCICLIKCRR